MEFSTLAEDVKVKEVRARSRSTVLRKLAQATKLEDEGLPLKELVDALEEREATAQTVIAPGFAVPHALTDWDGDFRMVLGRSRRGIDYGPTDTGPVHLVLLLVIGTNGVTTHLQLLAALAEFFSDEGFRQTLIDAKDARTMGRLIRQRAGLEDTPARRPRKVPPINRVIVRQALEVSRRVAAQALLIATDDLLCVPWAMLHKWPGRLLLISPDLTDSVPPERKDTHFIEVPPVSLARNDRANLGLLLSAARGLVAAQADVVCVTGAGGPRLDSIVVVRPGSHFEDMFGLARSGGRRILPAVILRAVTLALELADQGREGKAVGTMFVIGDSRQVLKHTQQLVLNPFHGYSQRLRSILDPSLGETIKEYALLDGAFVVQANGTVLSAGTYVIPAASAAQVTSGLGTRHQAAASITTHTRSMAIVVSQSTGTVVAFRQGKVILKLERAGVR